MQIVQRPVNSFNTGNNRRIAGIVLHHWVAVWTNIDTQRFTGNAANRASYHYGIDRNGEIAQFVQDRNIAWHAGTWNATTIGIGVSNSQMAAPWPVHQRTLDLLPQLLARLSRQHGLGELVRHRNFWLHRDVGNTACPGQFLTDRVNQILAEANRLIRGGATTPPQQPPAQQPTTWHRVQVGAFASTANANALLANLRAAGFQDAFINRGADNLHRVQVGAFGVRANAEARLRQVHNAGFRKAIIVTS